MTECKTAEELAAEQKAAADAAEAARIADEQRKRAEDDTTDLTMVPIITSGDVKIECLGMFFNQSQITSEDEPAKEMTIEKDVLDRTPQFFIGRFKAEIKDRSKIVYEVFMDGRKIDGYGTNLPYIFTSGSYDTTLFRWPGSARANKPGQHIISGKVGLITGIVESQLGLLEWDKIKAVTEFRFAVNLLPNKLPRD